MGLGTSPLMISALLIVSAFAAGAFGVAALSFVQDFEEDAGGPEHRMIETSDAAASQDPVVRHRSGPALEAQDYEVSLTMGSDSEPKFVACSGRLEAGGRLILERLTEGSSCDGARIVGAGTALEPGSDYRLVVRETSTGRVVVDNVIEFR